MSTYTVTSFASASPAFTETTYEVPRELPAFHVFVDILACGVCYTDLYRFDAVPGSICGHETVGTIKDVGPNVNHLKIGDIVGFGYLRSSCLDCHQCTSGCDIMCKERKLFSHGPGGFAHAVVWDSRFVYKIPSSLEPKYAAPLMCAGATVFAALYNNNVSPTARIGVIGIGGLGHLALQFCRAWGCQVVALSGSLSKKNEALSFGAHEFLNTKELTTETVKAQPKFDFILNTTTGDLPWDLYLSLLNPNGILCLVGFQEKPLEMKSNHFLYHQARVVGFLVASRGVSKKMLEFAARHNIKPMIEEYPMTAKGAANAMQNVRDGKVRYRAVLIVPQDSSKL
ncbi:hypothetical protein BC937DRAFT_88154 [Endogone sp. FLAS-F59071]|nr:hypothetical protein BC937DRAFT_88154 [Endogone sp. FLAS-F59071]|eukprot:RUS18933.1 hypothetical protein BC937DRAFT_88154 [Endogone sp. FLAS-F59071]